MTEEDKKIILGMMWEMYFDSPDHFPYDPTKEQEEALEKLNVEVENNRIEVNKYG